MAGLLAVSGSCGVGIIYISRVCMVVWRPWVSGWLCGVVGGVAPVVWCC